jgi:hypothetical protein
MELGARAAIRNFRSENANFQDSLADGEFYRVPGFADRYRFNDQVYAGYGTFSQTFKKWGYQVGLRAESSQYTGTLLDTDSTFNVNFPLQLFPSLFLTYKLNDEDEIPRLHPSGKPSELLSAHSVPRFFRLTQPLARQSEFVARVQ